MRVAQPHGRLRIEAREELLEALGGLAVRLGLGEALVDARVDVGPFAELGVAAAVDHGLLGPFGRVARDDARRERQEAAHDEHVAAGFRGHGSSPCPEMVRNDRTWSFRGCQPDKSGFPCLANETVRP